MSVTEEVRRVKCYLRSADPPSPEVLLTVIGSLFDSEDDAGFEIILAAYGHLGRRKYGLPCMSGHKVDRWLEAQSAKDAAA